MKEKLLGESHPDVGLALVNLGVIQEALGHASEAGSSLRRALAILEASLGASHPATAACRDDLAQLAAERNAEG